MTSTSYDINLANPPSVEPMDEEPCDTCKNDLGDAAYTVKWWDIKRPAIIRIETMCAECYRAKVIDYYKGETANRLENTPWEVTLIEPCPGCNYYRCRCD